jgi:sphingomyelin phosphodiesterase acid-like 3
MISDIHFDPFYDPAKVSRLMVAPVSGWEAILASADTATQVQDFAALQKTCSATAEDTPYPLLASALRGIRQNAASARFITVSGDLLAHHFDCRFKAAMPSATPAQYELFVEKTMQYVASRLEQTLPHATLYLSLGNNDSSCGDYQLDTGSPFLAAAAKIVGRGVGAAWNADAAKSFGIGGYYSVTMAPPMQGTRLIVVNDIFLGNTYKTCGGKPDTAAGIAQMQWLQQQLDEARAQHQRVWVMGHIPPGVNPYASLKKGPAALCKAGMPAMFMTSEVLGDTLTKNADVIRLAIFAHTHMDELRLLGSGEQSVAVKMVPSISPVNGNEPTFTVAQVDPASATLADYTTYNGSDDAGTMWLKEYTFSTAYGHKGFTPETLRAITDGFHSDAGAETPQSKAYIHFFPSSAPMNELELVWPAYVCALTHEHATDYMGCVCDAHGGGK